MIEIVKGLMTSLLASQLPLVAGAVLCVAVGWLARDIVGKRRRSKKNNNAGSRVEGCRTENGNEDSENKAIMEPNEDSENKAVMEPNKENETTEILEWAARNTEKNKGNVFDLKEIWVDAIEPVINISIGLRTKIQKSGINCSANVEARGFSKEGKKWFFYMVDDEIGNKGTLDTEMERKNISNEIVRMSINIRLLLTFADMETEILKIKGMFHRPGERIIGEWKDDRFIRGETEQSPRKGYDRDGIYEMLEEQMEQAIESWKKANC